MFGTLFVPPLCDESLSAYLTRAHLLSRFLEPGDALTVRDKQATARIQSVSVGQFDDTDELKKSVAQVTDILVERNRLAGSLSQVVYSASPQDGWTRSIDAAIQAAHRLNCVVLYQFGPLEVSIYPWSPADSEMIRSRVQKMARILGLAMEEDLELMRALADQIL